MTQSRRMSLLESTFNIAIGYLVALMTQLVVFPLLDIEVSINQNILIGIIFTVVSLIRSYALRRFFNWINR